jgi:hypothetical protein
VIAAAALVFERRTIASPIWVQLRDTFSRTAPRGPVDIRLERQVGQDWVPLDQPHRLSSGGDLAVVDLGRSREPAAIGTFNVRVWVTARGLIAEPQPLVVAVTAWPPEAPNVPNTPTECRLYPGPAYSFPPGTPVLAGSVVDGNSGAPVGRAAVTADETVNNAVVTEDVRTDDAGWFRLPLRWSSGATTVNAQKSRPPQAPLTGSITVNVPADLSAIQQIAVS